MIAILVGIVITFAVVLPIAVVWANAIDRQARGLDETQLPTAMLVRRHRGGRS